MENDNLEFWAELQAKGLNVVLVTQPVNLPDTNQLDLGFFMQCNLQRMRSPEERVRLSKMSNKYTCIT